MSAARTAYWKVRCFPSLKRPITWLGGGMSERHHQPRSLTAGWLTLGVVAGRSICARLQSPGADSKQVH